MANEEVDRRAEILNAAVELFGTLGYYGTSLQKIADRVGLTKAGVLHYVGSKEGLLTAALDEVYDSETEDILTDMVREPRPLIANMWRKIVAVNARRPLQVHMFSTLSAEAIDPNHPAHEYFANRELHNADTALNIRWRAPEGVDTRRLLNAGFAMMDGVQLRWLRTPGQDLNAMWAECEDALFPCPCGRATADPPILKHILVHSYKSRFLQPLEKIIPPEALPTGKNLQSLEQSPRQERHQHPKTSSDWKNPDSKTHPN